jgi:hypothetical protein
VGSLPDGIRWTLAALAAFRLTWSAVNDDGPGMALWRFRVWAGCYDRGPQGEICTALGRFLNCPYCVGGVLSLLPTVLALWPTTWGDVLLAWGGLAGAVALLIRWRRWD